MNEHAIKYQIVKITIPEANALVTVNINSDKLYKNISGLLVTMPFELLPSDKSQCAIVINDKEIFPENFEVKLIVCDLSIPVNERFYKIHEQAEGSTIKAKFKDGGMNGTTYPYQASLYLKLEEKI